MKAKVSKFFTLGIFLLLIPVVILQAQPGQGQGAPQQLEAQRIAFITKSLALTPAEAQQFWPLYNEYNQKRFEMMQKHRAWRVVAGNPEQLSEKELERIADLEISNMEEMTALRREYHEKYKKVLPLVKIIKLYDAERDFSRELYRENRRGQRDGRSRN